MTRALIGPVGSLVAADNCAAPPMNQASGADVSFGRVLSMELNLVFLKENANDEVLLP